MKLRIVILSNDDDMTFELYLVRKGQPISKHV